MNGGAIKLLFEAGHEKPSDVPSSNAPSMLPIKWVATFFKAELVSFHFFKKINIKHSRLNKKILLFPLIQHIYSHCKLCLHQLNQRTVNGHLFYHLVAHLRSKDLYYNIWNSIEFDLEEKCVFYFLFTLQVPVLHHN